MQGDVRVVGEEHSAVAGIDMNARLFAESCKQLDARREQRPEGAEAVGFGGGNGGGIAACSENGDAVFW